MSKHLDKRDWILYIFVPIFTAILGIVGACIVQNQREASLVKSMSARFDRIQENMDLEQALELVYTEKEEQDRMLQKMVEATVYSPSLVVDGLKQEQLVGKGIVELDGRFYYSSDLCARIWSEKPFFDQSNETVYYSKDNKAPVENKVDLIGENVIYDGKYLTIYQPSEGKTFSMGSDTFNKGFTVGADNYSLFGEGNGYALFDLKGQYSKLNINVARVNRDDLGIEDATLKVYLDEEYITEYALSGQKPPTSISIDLNFANSLKLEVCGSKIVYGFANGTLEK